MQETAYETIVMEFGCNGAALQAILLEDLYAALKKSCHNQHKSQISFIADNLSTDGKAFILLLHDAIEQNARQEKSTAKESKNNAITKIEEL